LGKFTGFKAAFTSSLLEADCSLLCLFGGKPAILCSHFRTFRQSHRQNAAENEHDAIALWQVREGKLIFWGAIRH
jgi:hypothetical protein